jgi:hypothetical protein
VPGGNGTPATRTRPCSSTVPNVSYVFIWLTSPGLHRVRRKEAVGSASVASPVASPFSFYGRPQFRTFYHSPRRRARHSDGPLSLPSRHLNNRARIADMSPCRLSLRERTSYRGATGDDDARPAIAHGYLASGQRVFQPFLFQSSLPMFST